MVHRTLDDCVCTGSQPCRSIDENPWCTVGDECKIFEGRRYLGVGPKWAYCNPTWIAGDAENVIDSKHQEPVEHHHVGNNFTWNIQFPESSGATLQVEIRPGGWTCVPFAQSGGPAAASLIVREENVSVVSQGCGLMLTTAASKSGKVTVAPTEAEGLMIIDTMHGGPIYVRPSALVAIAGSEKHEKVTALGGLLTDNTLEVWWVPEGVVCVAAAGRALRVKVEDEPVHVTLDHVVAWENNLALTSDGEKGTVTFKARPGRSGLVYLRTRRPDKRVTDLDKRVTDLQESLYRNNILLRSFRR